MKKPLCLIHFIFLLGPVVLWAQSSRTAAHLDASVVEDQTGRPLAALVYVPATK